MHLMTELENEIHFTIFFTLLLPVSLYASGAQTFEVEFVGCFSDGRCYIGIEPSAVTECVNKSQIRLNIQNPGANAQYAAALTAYSASHKLRVHVQDNCINGYPTPDYLHVTKE